MTDSPSEAVFPYHYADRAHVTAPPALLFSYLDEHARLSAHMAGRSWMIGGGKMEISADAGEFQRLGSRMRLAGRVFGLFVFLEEEVVDYRPPRAKTWRTIGSPRLLIIQRYRMGFEITRELHGSELRVFIDYDLPRGVLTRSIGKLIASAYARWCVRSMLTEGERFSDSGSA